MLLLAHQFGQLAIALIPLRSPLRKLARVCGYRNPCDLFQKSYLQSLGFDVSTIVDVGVDHGTKELYGAFENCFFVLVDPRRNAPSLLRYKPARYIFVNKALGAKNGHLLLREQEEGKTSLLERTKLTASPILAEYEVEVTTLDTLLESVKFEGSIGIKLDTEGYEIEIMKGLEKYKDITRFVICEASIRERFVGSYQFSDLIEFMLERDFLFFNFLNPTNRRPMYYDVIFVPRTSDLLK